MIVSVCKLSEGGRPKCHKYWPNGHSDNDPDFRGLIDHSKMKINYIKKSELGATLEKREFQILYEGKAHTVY